MTVNENGAVAEQLARNPEFHNELAELIVAASNISIIRTLPREVIAAVVDQLIMIIRVMHGREGMARLDPDPAADPDSVRAAILVCGILDETQMTECWENA
jgi:hypothetical protein